MFRTTFRPLRPHARTRDALSESGAGLGRAHRLGAGPGQELAADGLRFADPVGGLGARPRLAVGARHRHALGGAGRQARPGAGGRARASPTISRPIRRSPGISRASSRMSAALPADPIVLRQNWLRAYDFTTDRGAAALNDYARTNDPFAKLGKTQISVEVSSVIRASPTAFRVAWIERRYENGSLAATERWSAILTIVVQTAARRRSAAEESARRLRPRHQLVEGARTMTRIPCTVRLRANLQASVIAWRFC